MDAAARETNALRRTAKSCGPDSPTLESSLPVTSRRATAAKELGAPRRPRISRQTIAQGVPVPRLPCRCLRAQSAFLLHARPVGCGQHPALPAPSIFGGGHCSITRASRAARTRTCVAVRSLHEPTGRANARPMTGSAICGTGPGYRFAHPGYETSRQPTEPPTRNSRAWSALLPPRPHCYRPRTKREETHEGTRGR